MRIIGGSLRGKKLISFTSRKIRPTSDRVKESLFNIIRAELGGNTKVLDLFCGTGNLGIEAVSRGAAATFVEKDKDSLSVLKKNIAICGINRECAIIPMEVKKAIPLLESEGESFDIIFLDPPYGRELAGETMELLGGSSIASKALVIVEHSLKEDALQKRYGRLALIDARRYGDTSLSFFSKEQL